MEQGISPDPCRCRDFSGLAGGQVMFLKGMPVFVFKKSISNFADLGSDNYEQEFTLGLLQSERQLLREIAETPF